MTHIIEVTESITDFFTRYTSYLSSGEIDALANIYNYPALAVTALGCQVITDPPQTREFFKQRSGVLPFSWYRGRSGMRHQY